VTLRETRIERESSLGCELVRPAARAAFPTPAGVLHLFPDNPPPLLYRGKGCKDCRGAGYRGRIGIFELLLMSDALRDLVLARASEAKLLESAQRLGMITLRDQCLACVRNGETTLEELVRITVAS
jgi:type IV pilus assembly protein PilB